MIVPVKRFWRKEQIEEAMETAARMAGLPRNALLDRLGTGGSEIAVYIRSEINERGVQPIAWLRWMDEYIDWQYVANHAHPFVEEQLERGKARAKGEL
jgi:hypothetical protein